jgi:hypothetical protein
MEEGEEGEGIVVLELTGMLEIGGSVLGGLEGAIDTAAAEAAGLTSDAEGLLEGGGEGDGSVALVGIKDA